MKTVTYYPSRAEGATGLRGVVSSFEFGELSHEGRRGPPPDVGSHGIDLDDGRLGSGGTEAHGEKVEPGAEHQHAISLVHHAPSHGVGEGSQDAQVPRA